MEINNEIVLKSLFFNKVTTANEKVRMIKDAFELSLKDLARDDISTMCISNIINGKQGITPFSGECLVKNINFLLNVSTSLSWLLEETGEQADSLLETNIESYKSGQISINDLEKVVNENASYAKTSLLLNAYEILAEDYIDINYIKASTYINRGIEISFKVLNFEKEISFERLRGNIELSKGNTEHALKIYEGLKERTADRAMKYKVHFNIIICLRKLEKVDEMFCEIEVFKKTYDVLEDHKRYLRVLKANTFSKLKEYKKALQIYEELLIEAMKSNNIEYMCMLYYNIADIYFEIKELDLAKKYIQLRLKQNNDVYMVKHLLFAATVLNDLTYVQKAKNKLVEGDMNSLYSVYNKELEICIKNDDVEMLKTSLDSCIELGIKIDQPDLHLFMHEHFNREEYRGYLELFKNSKCF